MQTDWASWIPEIRANLCFVRRDNEVLLIRKKRGLGAGKINAPGGKIDPGEEEMEAAIRETQEEVGITPLELKKHGELYFQFVDGLKLYCGVFVATAYEGTAIETDEALPIWTKISEIPYAEMWQDDRHWLPGVLEGRFFDGYFEFDGDVMLSHRVEFWEAGKGRF